MLKRLVYSLFTAVVLASVAGCSSPEVFTEALQLKPQDKIYTRFNIRYRDPQEISARNYLQGNILQFGTEIDLASVNVKRISPYSDVWTISFKTVKDATEYRIAFDEQLMLQPVDEYIQKAFTRKTRDELLKGIDPKFIPDIERGQVVQKMNRDEVLLAYGYPPPHRTFSLKNDTWIYLIKPFSSRRVIFRGGKVRSIIDME